MLISETTTWDDITFAKEVETGSFKLILFGDSETDIEAGLAAGVSSFQFKGGNVLEFVKSHISFDSYNLIPTQE